MIRLRTIFGAILLVSSLHPLFGAWADTCPAQFSMTISASDTQIGLPVTITWTSTGAPITAQTLDISDVAYGMQLPPEQRSFTYLPAKSGTPHVQINASSGCDYVYAATKFHVQQCPIDTRPMTLTATEVDAGGTLEAFVTIDKNESVRWDVHGGTITATSGGIADITAGGPGTMIIDAYITKNGNCEAKVSRTVNVICRDITYRGDIWVSQTTAAPGDNIGAFINAWPDETLRWEVTGGTITGTDGINVSIQAGAPGTMEITAIIGRNGCEFRYSTSVAVACHDDPTIGLFFDNGAISPGGVVNAWTNLSAGETAHWEITNGTPATADGPTVAVTGGTTGLVKIHLIVTKFTYCTIERTAYIVIH